MNKFFSRYGKKNKYNAVRSTCRLGHDHRSRLESEYCFQLEIREKSGEIKFFVFERRFRLKVKGKHICDILPDFFIKYADGRREIHECKGAVIQPWPIKWALLQALYPKFNYAVIK